MNTREVTNQLLHMMDDGLISAKVLAEACLNYMSEAEVADMAHCNELIVEDEEETDWKQRGRDLEDFDMHTKEQ